MRPIRGVSRLLFYQLGFSIEKKTWQALCELAPSLVHVSKERVQVELTKTLLSDRPEFIWKTEAAGLAPYISKTFPEVFAAWKKKSCGKAEVEEASFEGCASC